MKMDENRFIEKKKLTNLSKKEIIKNKDNLSKKNKIKTEINDITKDKNKRIEIIFEFTKEKELGD